MAEEMKADGQPAQKIKVLLASAQSRSKLMNDRVSLMGNELVAPDV